MKVTKGSCVRVLCGSKALSGEVTEVFIGEATHRTRYEIRLISGSCVTTTIDAILEP